METNASYVYKLNRADNRICVIMIIICVTGDDNKVPKHAILYIGPGQIRTRGFIFRSDHNFETYDILERYYLQFVSRKFCVAF